MYKNVTMDGLEYSLTGFDGFLERRRVIFVQALLTTRVCGVCGVVPSRSLQLPCGHVPCQVCKDQISKEDGKCPLDDKEFAEVHVVPKQFKQSDLEQLQVLCIAGGRKCKFSGKLGELRGHMTECGSDKVRCARCQCFVLRNLAVEHCRQCTAETVPRKTTRDVNSSFVEKLRGMKNYLESMQEKASRGQVDQYAIVNGANYVMELMTCLERDLIQEGNLRCHLPLPPVKKTAINAGPYRGGSKSGVFVTTCQFSDVYAAYKALIEGKKTHRLGNSIYTLAGYTFWPQCKFQALRNGEVVVSFVLFLGDGSWNSCVEWPFSRNVTIILTHPSDEAKDRRLPISMNGPQVVKKPAPDGYNMAHFSKAVNWRDIELQGFVAKSKLYVNVEFE